MCRNILNSLHQPNFLPSAFSCQPCAMRALRPPNCGAAARSLAVRPAAASVPRCAACSRGAGQSRTIAQRPPSWRPLSALDECVPPTCRCFSNHTAVQPGGGDGFGDVVLQRSWAHVASVLQRWVAKEARPVSLRQLMFFGRSLTEPRLLSSANYVRTELPTRYDEASVGIRTRAGTDVARRHCPEYHTG